MTAKPRVLSVVTRLATGIFLLVALAFAVAASAPADKHRGGKAKAVKGRVQAKNARGSRNERSARGRHANAREDRNARSGKRGRVETRDRHGRRESARDRKLARITTRDLRHMSKKERRRILAEMERRRRAAIAAAIARRRAADKALRDESEASILRDDMTGEDMEVRRVAMDALSGHAGSVVVMDPKSGRVYSIVNQDWAVRKGYKPCSTVKLVTGLAGLTEKVINPVQTLDIGVTNYHLDLTDSIAFSNNGYFQNVGGQVGFDKMVGYARELGFGQPSGINEGTEYAGRVPVFKSGYAVNHMSSHGDDFEVTPVQLASLVSAMANGGNLIVPHVPKSSQELSGFKPTVRRTINIPQEAIQRMTPGMIGAVNYGTAKLAFDPRQTIAGKTGSCIGQGSWLGLFTSYAPVQDPKLAVVVVTRGSGERGKYAAGVAGKIYRALGSRFGATEVLPIAVAPKPKIDARTAARISDEDKEDEAADAAEINDDGNATAVTSGVPASGSKIQRVIMTAGPQPKTAPKAVDGYVAPVINIQPSGSAPPREIKRPRIVPQP